MSNEATERLGIKHPIIQGPFGGGLSTLRLVATVSNAGGLGSFGAHVTPPDRIEALARDLHAQTNRAFALNLWISDHDPGGLELTQEEFERVYRRFEPYFRELGMDKPERPQRFHQSYEAQVEALLEARPPVFSFVFGIPSAKILAECRRRGIVTLGAATSIAEGKALEEAGIDLIVATGLDAGGHRPAFLAPAEESLMGTMSVTQLIAARVRVPVIAAGGIADGRGVRAALALGAQAAQIGTAFLACEESGTSPEHREILFSDRAQRTVLTRAFSGRPKPETPQRRRADGEPDRGSLGSVIGVPEQDRLGAIDLLGQQDAGQQMRPGHGSQGEDEGRTVDQAAVEPVGAANGESEIGNAVIAPARQTFGEVLAGESFAGGIEGHARGALGDLAEQQIAFGGAARLDRQLAPLLDLAQLEGQAGGAARHQPPCVVVKQRLFRRAALGGAAASHGGHDDTHGRGCRVAGLALLAEHSGPGGGSLRLRQIHRPHLLEIVVGAGFRPEQVDDHIARVDEHPVALVLALDGYGHQAAILELHHEVVGHGGELALRAPGRDDHEVGDGRFGSEIDGEDLFGLVGVEGGLDQRQDRRGRPAFGRLCLGGGSARRSPAGGRALGPGAREGGNGRRVGFADREAPGFG